MDLFRFNLYGGDLTDGLFEQVRATMLVTVFVFIGIEGASVYSRFAKERADVGKATIMGFIGVTGLMVLVTLLPYAVLQRADIAGLRQPSMAGVLESVVGPWGAIFVSVGLIVSVLGAYLAWALICAEVMFAAGKSKDMPAVFAKVNKNNVPVVALWVTSIIIQLIVITTYWSRDAFSLMLNLTSATTLIPYLFVAAYGLMIAKRGETYDQRPEERQRDLILSSLAVAYTLFMIYAGGLKYILLSAVLFGPGTVLYVWARREQGKAVFDKTSEWVTFGVIVAARGLRRLRHRDRFHQHLVTCLRSTSWQRQRRSRRKSKEGRQVRRALGGRAAAQGDGVRTGRRALRASRLPIATSCCSTTCCGSTMPSATTSTSSTRCATAASKSWRCTTCWPRRWRSRRARSGSSTTRSCRTRWAWASSTNCAAISRASTTASSPRR